MTRFEFARLIAKTFKKDENLIQRSSIPFPSEAGNSKIGSKASTGMAFFRMDTFNVEDYLELKMPSVEESLQVTLKRLSGQSLA